MWKSTPSPARTGPLLRPDLRPCTCCAYASVLMNSCSGKLIPIDKTVSVSGVSQIGAVAGRQTTAPRLNGAKPAATVCHATWMYLYLSRIDRQHII